MAYLKITSTPKGEAPLWVRECWVGLLLPLMEGFEQPVETETVGVLTGARTNIGQFLASIFDRPQIVVGYVVESLPAIELLADTSPEAAAWWQVHVPNAVVSGETFVFESDVGYVVATDAS